MWCVVLHHEKLRQFARSVDKLIFNIRESSLSNSPKVMIPITNPLAKSTICHMFELPVIVYSEKHGLHWFNSDTDISG